TSPLDARPAFSRNPPCPLPKNAAPPPPGIGPGAGAPRKRLGSGAVRGAEHVLAFDHLDAFTALVFAEAALVGVELVPAVPRGVRVALGIEELEDRVLGRVLRLRETARLEILEQARDRLVGVALGG